MPDLVLAATVLPVLAGLALVVYGMSTSTGMVAYQSTLQAEVPAELRGRAFALFDVIWNASRLASLGLAAVVADAVDVRVVYLVGAVLLFAAALTGFTGTAPARHPNGRDHPGGK